jgi:hypothetical protein
MGGNKPFIMGLTLLIRSEGIRYRSCRWVATQPTFNGTNQSFYGSRLNGIRHRVIVLKTLTLKIKKCTMRVKYDSPCISVLI